MDVKPGPGEEGSWDTLRKERDREHGWRPGSEENSGAPSERSTAESMCAAISSWMFAELQDFHMFLSQAAPVKTAGLFKLGCGLPGLCSRGNIASWVLASLKTQWLAKQPMRAHETRQPQFRGRGISATGQGNLWKRLCGAGNKRSFVPFNQ